MRDGETLRVGEAGLAAVPLAQCALARAVAVIGDTWTLLILREAACGMTRFEEIRADLGIPRTVLSDRLGRLVEAGLFRRVPYREPGQRTRHAYELSDKGRALFPALVALRQWAEAQLPGPPANLQLRHRGCGARVRNVLVCEEGHRLGDPAEIETVIVEAEPAEPT